MIFAGKKSREQESQQNFMDGTFKSCPSQFEQLYTIHADLGSTQEETNIVPVIFALLPNRKKETYLRLFFLIKKELPLWRPTKIVVDFEAAAIAAIREVFPGTSIHGCYFHFKQCLWRKVQEIGLVQSYKLDKETRNTIQLCGALSFLKPADVEEGWLFIMENITPHSQMTEFLDYFVGQWMENSNIPISLWNSYRHRHRTNNAVEGWNHKINSSVGRPNPKVKDLLTKLKLETEKTEISILRTELNLAGVKR